MNSVTSRTTLIAAIMGFLLGAIMALGNVSAADEEIILHEAIHDYSDDAYYGNFSDSSNTTRGNPYRIRIVLDEAQLDYVSDDIAAFNRSDAAMESAEFAVFEESFDVPWEITAID